MKFKKNPIMRHVLIMLLCLASFSLKAFAQYERSATFQDTIVNSAVESLAKEDTVYGITDKLAFPKYNIDDYFAKNIKISNEVIRSGIRSIVTVQFIVEKNGTISNPTIVKGGEIGKGLPEEALRVISQMPPWIPAMNDGESVRSYMRVPIAFGAKQKINYNAASESANSVAIDSNVILKTGAFYRIAPLSYFNSKIKYPKEALANNIQGKVTVQFIVEKNGSLSDIEVKEGTELAHGIPEEAVRLVKSMSKWTPAVDNRGNAIRVKTWLSISFYLP